MKFPDPRPPLLPLTDAPVHGEVLYDGVISVYNANERTLYTVLNDNSLQRQILSEESLQWLIERNFKTTGTAVSADIINQYFTALKREDKGSTFNFRGIKVHVMQRLRGPRYGMHFERICLAIRTEEIILIDNSNALRAFTREPNRNRRNAGAFLVYNASTLDIPNTLTNVYARAIRAAATVAAYREGRKPSEIDMHGLPEYEGRSDAVVALMPIDGRTAEPVPQDDLASIIYRYTSPILTIGI